MTRQNRLVLRQRAPAALSWAAQMTNSYDYVCHAGQNGAAVPAELINEALAAASLTDVLLKLTGEGGYSFVEPIVRCERHKWPLSHFHVCTKYSTCVDQAAAIELHRWFKPLRIYVMTQRLFMYSVQSAYPALTR